MRVKGKKSNCVVVANQERKGKRHLRSWLGIERGDGKGKSGPERKVKFDESRPKNPKIR